MNLINSLSQKTITLFSKKTKDRILQESLLLFNDQSFNLTTTAKIAKSSNVLEGSLWYHYNSKKDLLIEHINLFRSSLKSNLENLKDGNQKNVIEKLLGVYGILWDFRYIFRDSFESYVKKDKKLSKSLNEINTQLDAFVDDVLVYCIEIGIIETNENDLNEIGELVLIVGKHWLDYSKKKYPKESNLLLKKRGVNLLIKVLYPYLSNESKEIMDSIYDSG